MPELLPHVGFADAIDSDLSPDDRLAWRVKVITSAAPSLARDPNAALALAKQPIPDQELLSSIDRAGGMAEAQSAARRLGAFPELHQRKAWDKMSKAEQEALMRGGFRPTWIKPKVQKNEAGFNIGKPVGALFRGAVGAVDTLTTPLQAGIGAALDVAAKPSRAVSRAYRAGRDLIDEVPDPIRNAARAQGFFAVPDPHDDLTEEEESRVNRLIPNSKGVMDAWRNAKDGERVFTPRAALKALDALGTDDPDLWAYVTRRAGGDTLEELAEEYGGDIGTSEYETAFVDLAQLDLDPKVTKALSILGNGKISPGRDLARGLGLKEGSAPFSVVSGAGDASFQWYTDPFLGLGKVRKGYLAARYGLELADGGRAVAKVGKLIGDDVAERAAARTILDPTKSGYAGQLAGAKLNNTERMATTIADHFRATDIGDRKLAELQSSLPGLKRMLGPLRDYDDELRALRGRGITDPGDVRNFFIRGEGLRALASGHATSYTADNLILPRLGRLHTLGLVPKRAAEDTINFLVDSEHLIKANITDDDLVRAGLNREDLSRLRPGKASKLIPDERLAELGVTRRDLAIGRALSVPFGPPAALVHAMTNLIPKEGYLVLDGPKTAETLDQVLGFGFRGAERRKLFNEFVNASHDGARRNLASSFLNTIFERAGILNDPRTAEWADRFVSYTRQAYAPGGMDEIQTLGGTKHVGLLPQAHRADAVALPNFGELIAQSRRLNASRFFFGTVNNRAVEAWMQKVWKPSVLLRIGFIPRAAGEEMLAFALRHSPKALFQSYVAIPTALGPVYEGNRLAPAGRQLVGFDDTKPIWAFDWAAHSASRLARIIPEPVLMQFGSMTDAEQLGHYLEARASGVSTKIRKFAQNRVVDKDLLEAARDLASHPTVGQAVIEEIGGINAFRDPSLKPDMAKGGWRDRKLGDTDFRPVHSDFKVAGQNDITYMWGIDGRLNELQHDAVGRALASVASAYVSPDQAARIASQLDGVDDGFEAVAKFQDSFSAAPPAIRDNIFKYVEEHDDAYLDKAQGVLLKLNMTVEEKSAVEDLIKVLPKLAMRDRELLLTNSSNAMRHIDEIYEELDEGRLAVRRNLLNEARRGDGTARDLLMEEVAHVRMGQPDLLPDVLKMELANQLPDGTPVAGGVSKGYTRVYSLMIDNKPVSSWATTDLGHARSRLAEAPEAKLGYVDLSKNELSLAQERPLVQPDGTTTKSKSQLLIDDISMERVSQFSDDVVEIDGQLVEGVTQDAALRALAQRQRDYVNYMLTSRQTGETMHEVARAVSAGRYTPDHVLRLTPDDLPLEVTVPEYQAVTTNRSTEIVNNGFEYIGRALHSLIRRPMYLQGYAKGLKFSRAIEDTFRDPDLTTLGRTIVNGLGDEGQSLLRVAASADVRSLTLPKEVPDSLKELWMGMTDTERRTLRKFAVQEDNVTSMTRDIAMQRALADVIPFIDDHRIRSEMDVYVRNIAPFLFAETQFLKRWARTLRHSPEALRKAQLTYMGVKHAGWIEQNEFGEDVFVYPGSEHIVNALGKVAEPIFGGDWQLPVAAAMTGQVRFAAPGADSPGKPGFSPLVAVPMNLLSRRFPELHETSETLLGERGADRTIPEMIFPTSAMRFYRTFNATVDKDAQYASAVMSAMQIMEANGLAPAADADAAEKEQYIDRVKNWGRIVLLTRAAIGFAGPAAPALNLPESLTPEFQRFLRAGLPFEEALAQFMARHPDATAFSVFSTESESKAPLPATAEALNFMSRHEGFLGELPNAGPWFLPQASATDPYVRRARNEQFALDMRRRKGVEEFYNDLKYAAAAEEYFTSQQAHEDAQLGLRSVSARKQEREAWRAWKEQYFVMHPIFAQMLQDPAGSQKRKEILDEMEVALERPEAQEAPHYDSLRVMFDSHRNVTSALDALIDDRSARATKERKRIRQEYADFALAYANENPEIRAFYYRVIRPEIGVDPTEED